jgi:DNA-binding transcriptional LysR family regulator
VQVFERSVGQQVFERTTKGVVLTEFGETLMDHARAIRAEAQSAVRHAEARRDLRRHLFVLDAQCSPLRIFGKTIAEFMKSSDVVVHLRKVAPEDAVELMETGEAEMAFAPLLVGEGARGLRQDLLFYAEIGLFVRHDHPVVAEPEVDLQQLGKLDWVLGPPGSPDRLIVESLFWTGGVEPPNVTLEVDDIAVRRSVVKNADYVSAFRTDQVESELAAGAVTRLPFDWPQSRSAVGAIRLTEHTSASRGLVDALKVAYQASDQLITSLVPPLHTDGLSGRPNVAAGAASP